MNGASAIHLSIFGMQPVVKHGSDELKAATLPRIVNGDLHVCFGVTEPGAGLDTSRITTFAKREGDNYRVNGRKVWISKALESEKILLLTRTTPYDEVTKKTDGMTLFLTDLDRDHVDIRPIKKMGRNAVSSNEVFIDDLIVSGRGPGRRGGQGLQVHPRRAQPRTDADRRRGAGHRAGRAGEGRQVRQRARRLRPADRHEPGHRSSRWPTRWPGWTPPNWCCARRPGSTTTANRVGARRTRPSTCAPTPVSAPPTARCRLHGGMGYSEEYHVSRYFRESRLMKIAPVSQEMILNFLGEHVLGMPRSY